MTADYVTVLRAPSTALLLPDHRFEINFNDPARVRLQSLWREQGLEHPVPADLFHVMIDPVVVGGGKRLFRDDEVRRPLRLLDSQVTTTGVIIASYAPARG